jgi:sporulation protein YlmC with PRC-barrel domain
MTQPSKFASAAFAAGLIFAVPALGQQSPQDQQPGRTQGSQPDTSPTQPQDKPSGQPNASTAAPMQVPGPTTSAGATPSPNLAVATVKMENGVRASKMIGAAVYNDQNQQVGTVDDIILDHDNKAVLAVISVGGFLGVGGKLVAVSYTQLHEDNAGKVVLPDASKEALNKMPSFVYGT